MSHNQSTGISLRRNVRGLWAGAHERTQIAFPSKTPLGLVGNGASIVNVRPSGEGVEFLGPVERITPLQVATREAFTDFAISKPCSSRSPGLERTASYSIWMMASGTRSPHTS